MQPENSLDSLHPGSYIKAKILPPGLSVKTAAELLGVGRPALSNLLNGKSSLSSEMALRLEKTFGADKKALLERQAEFDRARNRVREPHVAVRTYVPSFLTITARDMEGWAHGNLQARALFSVFLRKLVNSTGQNLTRVDFPGYDQSERKGWDGWVETTIATPWIPVGKSGWEFGCNEDPKQKADHDFAARIKAVSDPAERLETGFVFVTPRKWGEGKEKWLREKQGLGEWKSVVAYDSSNLEQWLEQSIATQAWFAEQLGRADIGAESLDEHWRRWSSATEPALSKDLFESSVQSHAKILATWLRDAPARPLIVSADSKDEALAFLFCAFNEGELAAAGYKDRVLGFSSPQTLRKVLSTTSNFIAVTNTEEVEREISGSYRHLHTILIRPRNSVEATPDIALDLLNYDDFNRALTAMGIKDHHQIEDLARDSGASPTILRRRLSRIPGIKTPPWAKNHEAIKALIPMMLVGAWHAQSNADCEILRLLAGTAAYDDVERRIAALLAFDDPPVWSVRNFRGVVSKKDSFFAIQSAVTPRDLDNFLLAAEIVLSETDPALELPEDKRIFAGLHGKTREHSSALRDGICETLVLLAVHGNTLFTERLGINVQQRVNGVIRRLLTPLSQEKLLSQKQDLPRYAEAAPEEFLKIMEEDLRTAIPQVSVLMKPTNSGIFGAACPRTGLLWAFEILAWKPELLLRVSVILAQLAEYKIQDNWSNKPENSLLSIYRAWLPQTAAPLEARIKALEFLVRYFPSIAWQLCLDQFAPGHKYGSYTARPCRRTDAAGAGNGATARERYEFARKALDLALAWPKHDEQTLGDLVANLEGVPEDEKWKLWDLIENWAKQATDDRKAILRERIRRYGFRNRNHEQLTTFDAKNRAREVYAILTPQDSVLRYEWLFKAHWVQESAEEFENEQFDVRRREHRVRNERISALQKIWSEKGFDGLQALIRKSGAESTIGWHMAEVVIQGPEAVGFLRQCLTLDESFVAASKMDELVRGFLLQTDAANRQQITKDLLAELPAAAKCRLLKCSPFQRDTWVHIDAQETQIRRWYWGDVYPGWLREDSPEINEAVDRLLDASRPRAAFSAVHFVLKEVETIRLKRLLRQIATSASESADTYPLDEYDLSSALKVLQERPGVTREEMAQLEFMFINVLEHSQHGIPNLEHQISESPALFMHALALSFKRSDDGQDPPEWRTDNQQQKAALARAAYSLLEKIKRIPGTDTTGTIQKENLRAWLAEARTLCEQYGRAEIGDQRIGQLLHVCPPGSDGVWPCEAVRDVLEEIRSEDIAVGMAVGVYNSRGVHARAPGGSQEWVLADTYRSWSSRLTFDHPYVAKLVEQIAKGYEDEAGWHDAEHAVQRRLRG